MNTKYCPSCGHPNEYSMETPKTCAKCKKPMAGFFKSSAKSVSAAPRAQSKPIVARAGTQLTEEQKNFIDENKDSMKFLDIARLLFEDESLTGLSAQAKSVYTYIQSSKTATEDEGDDSVNFDEIEATASELAERIRNTVTVAEAPPFRVPAQDVSKHPDMGRRTHDSFKLPDYSE